MPTYSLAHNILPSSRHGIFNRDRTSAEHRDHNVSPFVPLLGDMINPCLLQELAPFPDLLPS